jgi:predicted nucleotidyltransferase component of viral defense system
MIAEAELRRLAATWGIDPMIADLDYVLGCFLSQWIEDPLAKRLRFKGGTCLRKCYIADYRFSEDLDFTAETRISESDLQELLDNTIFRVRDVFGLNLAERPPRIEVVNDEYGKESFQARLYYRGPLNWRGDPRAIRLDISHDEHLGLPAADREIIHPYSDRHMVSEAAIPCYDLAEMLAEKLRALSGQRRFAVSRDLYDVYQLVAIDAGLVATAKDILPEKFGVKGLEQGSISVDLFQSRQEQFQRDWARNLRYLLPSSDTISFEDAWVAALSIISKI